MTAYILGNAQITAISTMVDPLANVLLPYSYERRMAIVLLMAEGALALLTLGLLLAALSSNRKALLTSLSPLQIVQRNGKRKAFVSAAGILAAICAVSHSNVMANPVVTEGSEFQSQATANGGSTEKSAEKPVTLNNSEADSLFRAAQESWEKKETEQALASLEQAITISPRHPKYLDKYGEFITAAASYARGEKFLTALLQKGESADLHYQIGRVAGESYRRATTAEERQRAMILSLDHLSSAIELNNKHWEARLTRGIMSFYLPPGIDQLAEATADFEWLVKEKPDLAVAYRFLSDCYVKSNDKARAKTILIDAIARFPNDQKLKDRLNRLAGAQN